MHRLPVGAPNTFETTGAQGLHKIPGVAADTYPYAINGEDTAGYDPNQLELTASGSLYSTNPNPSSDMYIQASLTVDGTVVWYNYNRHFVEITTNPLIMRSTFLHI